MNEQNMDMSLSYGASHDALKKSVSSGIFIASIIMLALFSVVSIVDSIVNIFFFGTMEIGSDLYLQATRVAAMVYSRFGYMIVGLIKLLVPVACIYSLVYFIKLRTTKCEDPITHIFKARRASSVLSLFALLTCIQCAMFVFAFSFNMFKADNYNFIVNACSFFGITELYSVLGLADFFAGLTGTFGKIVVTVVVDLVVAVYAVAQFLMYKWMKDFHVALADIVGSGIAQMQEKPPFVLNCVFCGVNIVISIFMLINGSFISAIVGLALAAYLISMGFFLRKVKKTIQVAGNVE